MISIQQGQQPSGDESNDQRPAEDNRNETKIYLTDNSTLQTPEEFELDKNRDAHEESQVVATSGEDHNTANSGIGGTDRAGTSERKE